MTDAKRSEWKFLTPPGRGAMLCYWGRHEVYFADDSLQLSAEQLNVTCDALNVHEATGLTPLQLQARVAELEAALDGAVLAERAECAAMAEAFKVHGYDYTGNFELHEAIRDRKNLGFGA